jgi:hypothetical protein
MYGSVHPLISAVAVSLDAYAGSAAQILAAARRPCFQPEMVVVFGVLIIVDSPKNLMSGSF